jgi:hypothetical protein
VTNRSRPDLVEVSPDVYARQSAELRGAAEPGGVAYGRTAAALILATVAAALLLPEGLLPFTERTRVAFAAVAVAILCIAALQLVRALPGTYDGIARWRIGPWYLIWTAIAFGVASLTWLRPATGAARMIRLDSVALALTLVGGSVLVWTVGYLVGPTRPLRRVASGAVAVLLKGTVPAIRGIGAAWILYGVGSCARLVTAMAEGRFGYIGDPSTLVSSAKPYAQVLNTLAAAAVFGIAVAAYDAFTTGRLSTRLTLALLVSVEVVAGAISGGKQTFIMAALAVLIPYGAVRRRVSVRFLVVSTLLFLWIVMPFNAAFRPVVRGAESTMTPAEAVAAAPGVLADVVYPDDPASVLPTSMWALLHRIRLIDSVAITAQMTPRTIAYRSPAEFAVAPVVALIPRAVWPDKPIIANGYRFSQEYYGLPSTVYTSSAPTPFGDLYRHGGLLVLLIGMLVLGACCRLFDTMFRPEADPRAMFFLIMFLPLVVKSEVDVYSMIVAVPASVVAAAVGAQLACRPRGRALRA